MLSKVLSAATLGIEAFPITVEVDARFGEKPSFTMVGLPDAAVREAYSRVRSALANCGLYVPPRVITVNLSPANVRKEGSAFDLPIALGMLHAIEKLEDEHLAGRVFVGELSLDGTLAPIRGALSIASAFGCSGPVHELVLPQANAKEAAAARTLRAIGAPHLPALLEHLFGKRRIEPAEAPSFCETPEEGPDFAEVRSQALAKRALEVAAAGGHNLMLIGPPGSGKTMLARRLPSILPRLSTAESIETTKIHSVCGLLPSEAGLVSRRPFRAPHHTISYAGLVGGGAGPRPGEVSLAHNGVLFLDELTEFRREILEMMRQPMEDGQVTIARAARSLTYPARFTLVAALNPCPCGYFNDARHSCKCSPDRISRYLGKISGPMLDRIDLQVEVPTLNTGEITSAAVNEKSSAIRKRVEGARDRQRERFQRTKIQCNGDMTTRELPHFCVLDSTSRRLLASAIDRLNLSARAYDRILKVARTIADLEGTPEITSSHVAEAIQYRALDKGYFGK